MTRAKMAGGAFVTLLVLLALAAGFRALRRDADPAAAPSPAATPSTAAAGAAEEAPGFLYGRVTTNGGTHEGRLRWGDGAEAFWGDYFNGRKDENPWAAYVPAERLPRQRYPIKLLGFELYHREGPISLGRNFMTRFGDVTRIEARGRDVRVTLKSGTVLDFDRFGSSDFDDGVRVWDANGRAVKLDALKIVSIDLLPTARLAAAPSRLQGTVRTRQGDFTGFIQWNRKDCVDTDELEGRTADGEPRAPSAPRAPRAPRDHRLRFDTIRSIARRSPDSVRVTRVDGSEIELTGTRETGRENLGVYVDDRRYGRVLISWDAFERVDFSPAGGSGPAYGDFPPGSPLTGSVATRSGRRIAGRLVFDLDESETTDTLDAPFQGVDFIIPFGLIASIVRSGPDERETGHARVTLRSGEELRLERSGDLRELNGGMLIFSGGSQRPEYVPWTEVGRVDLDRPPAMYPPLAPI